MLAERRHKANLDGRGPGGIRGEELSSDSKEPGLPREQRSATATLSAEHRMDDAPAGIKDRQADRCVDDYF